MAVSNYIQECKYDLSRLKNVIHLFPSRSNVKYEIDRGAAYADYNVAPISLYARSVTLSETEELDERYEFTHNVTFTLDGYNTLDDIHDRYYIAVEDYNGTHWLLNPYFPAKVTYEYTLAENRNETRYTFATVSNFPVLQLYGVEENNISPKCKYAYDAIKEIYLNEKIYSRFSNDGRIYYSNDGFKKVDFNKYSASFTETYNGDTVQHRVSFDIPFDYYKSSWHYNLLEFTENKYASIIRTVNGENILCGFGYGLQPSYEVSCEGNESPNRINITLFDLHSDEGLTTYFDENVNIGGLTETTWQFTTKYDGYECVSEGLARYLLQEEVDAFGNPTGNYRCLQGFENQFSHLNIVGTFTFSSLFETSMCLPEKCDFSTSLPSTNRILFTENDCKTYYISSSSDWNIFPASVNGFTISPVRGQGMMSTILNICATNAQPQATAEFTLYYCNGESNTWKLEYIPAKAEDCFTDGVTYRVGASTGSLNVRIECCVQEVISNPAMNAITFYDGYIRFQYPSNTTGQQKIYNVSVTLCDGKKATISIIQSAGYERWVKEGTVCDGNNLCDVERRYTGTTPSIVTGRTEETRKVNCSPSNECETLEVQWVDTDETYCQDGKLYDVEAEMRKDGNGEWYFTGEKRLGPEIPDTEGLCKDDTIEWRATDGYICDGTNKYARERLYINGVAQDVYRKGLLVLERNSTDCGYDPKFEEYPYNEWRCDDTACNGLDKYEYCTQWFSKDGEQWEKSNIHKYGSLIETNSKDCGYIDPYEYRWVLTDNTICGNGVKP